MITFGNILVIILLIWVSLYTISFGVWTWKKKNKLGAVMVCLLATVVLVLPIYMMFFRY